MAEPQTLSSRLPRRSMGLKLLLVCALALVMTIPALFVFMLLSDRTNRAEQVMAEVGQLVGGPQTFLGPVIAVPYAVPTQTGAERGVYVIFPAQGSAEVATTSEVRTRSLFKVPVYRADIAFRARFDLTGAPAYAPPGAVLDWDRAEFLIGVSDPRGAQADASLTAGGRTLPLSPAITIASSGPPSRDMVGPHPTAGGPGRYFGAPATGIAQPGARFDLTANLRFSGAQRLALLAYGKSTSVNVTGDWPHPSFDGGFLPTQREVGDQGFRASWTVPFIARGVPAEGTSDALGRLESTALGISFVEPGDPYQSVARSLKYALLFVGLVFLAYFLFEATTGKRVHPAQYVLIGLAQIVFYLLLLSIAERTGFDIAFLIAAGSTVGLISAYAGWVFESRGQGLRALAAFSFLYGLIYVLMRLEDFALLIGAIASFGAIAAVMYFTRGIDWYGESAAKPEPSVPARP